MLEGEVLPRTFQSRGMKQNDDHLPLWTISHNRSFGRVNKPGFFVVWPRCCWSSHQAENRDMLAWNSEKHWWWTLILICKTVFVTVLVWRPHVQRTVMPAPFLTFQQLCSMSPSTSFSLALWKIWKSFYRPWRSQTMTQFKCSCNSPHKKNIINLRNWLIRNHRTAGWHIERVPVHSCTASSKYLYSSFTMNWRKHHLIWCWAIPSMREIAAEARPQ